MRDRVPAEVFPPGEYVRDELEERGWSQVEFAEILGFSASTVSNLIQGKRSLTPEVAKALEAALGPSAAFWLNLDAYYRIHTTPEAPPSISRRAKLRERYPVRDMIQRGWIVESSSNEVVESRVLAFFGTSSVEEEPQFPYAAKKSAGDEDEPPPRSQLAWLFRVKQLAEAMPVGRYSERRLRESLPRIQALTSAPEEIRHVPGILEDCGVRFVIVEPLPGSKIDGVCFWIGGDPVIGMTLRFDRIDNFWFVLRHEIEHVLRRDAMAVDTEMEKEDENLPEQEKLANRAAAEFCVPSEELENFIVRVEPLFSRRRVEAFAAFLGVHPGLVVGQLHHKLKRWDLLRDYLVGIRDIVVPNAMSDGYGAVCPV